MGVQDPQVGVVPSGPKWSGTTRPSSQNRSRQPRRDEVSLGRDRLEAPAECGSSSARSGTGRVEVTSG